MSTRISLSIYRIREIIDGSPVTSLDDPIANPEELLQFDLIQNQNFEAKLFIADSRIRRPPWIYFLESGFGDLYEVEDSVTNSAVLIAKVTDIEDCYFAITFGFGRYLLKHYSYNWNYGLRVALNAYYPSAFLSTEPNWARIRSVDAKTVSSNTVYTRKQMDRRAIFEDFGVDIQRDLLKSVTGQPVDIEKWGTRLTGASALRITRMIDFAELGDLLLQVERTSRNKDYQQQFSWIDNLRSISDLDTINNLDNFVLEDLKNKEITNLGLAPPELIDWDALPYFRYPLNLEQTYEDVDIDHYLDMLEDEGKLSDLSLNQLKKGHKLEALDDAKTVIFSWPIYKCIHGELNYNDKTYILNAGDYFEIADDYLGELNNFIAHIDESELILPKTKVATTEGDYNIKAAKSSTNYILLDKKTVRVSSRTSPIEICDILTHDGKFIHVKRKLQSSSLSHLFGQGYVSGDLFHMSFEYRKAVQDKIIELEQELATSEEDEDYRGRFSSFNLYGISPSSYEIVYAIVADWKKRPFFEAIPFFSKVNLRRFTDDLRRMGFHVCYKMVHASSDKENEKP